jgi:hypothetical protein
VKQTESTQTHGWFGVAPRAAPPTVPGYVLCAHVRAELLSLSVCGAVLVPLWAFVFAALVGALGGRSNFTVRMTPTNIVLGVLVAVVAAPVVHELLHGLAARLVGARPTFGAGPGYAYTTFDELLHRGPFLVVGLAPLATVSVVAVALAVVSDRLAGWLVFFAVVNAAGAIGDLWMTGRVLRLPRHALFCDLADGFAALTPTIDG